ncbi:MAG TPA: NADH-quinone oxidoreductase subunit A, partial [Vicinamibacteria bacterium]|nr:NADH-quinone oxidoreductase subunit A [Vicinamibacteria bacterium]
SFVLWPPAAAPAHPRRQELLPAYVPLLILGGVVVGFAVFTLVLSQMLGKPRPTAAKSATYECGVPPVVTARERFPIKFYLVCMIFILLDVDAAFLYPWALIFRDLGVFGFVEMLVFVSLLGVGFVYAWKQGALDW